VAKHDKTSGASGASGGGIPRAFVPSDEREQVLAAVADVVSVVGYGAMTLEDVADRVGVDPASVRAHFPDEEAAFLAAYDAAVWQGLDRVLAGVRNAAGFADKVWAGWGAFIEFIVSEPAFASMCIVDVLAVGRVGIERRNATLRGMAALIEQIADECLEPDRPRPADLYLPIVLGGITEVVREHLAEGRIAELPHALPSMHYALLVPYVGHPVAREEYERRSGARG
jgi:AcrR family transcriptional regulator